MRKTLISYTADSRGYLGWIQSGRPTAKPSDVPFWLPYETTKGDRYLLFVGGVDQSYVGWGTIESDWREGRGAWKGNNTITVIDHMFREPLSGEDVFAATGFSIPKREKIVPDEYASSVWRVAKGRKLSIVERAVEGIATESRSRQRDPGLRLAALQRANGRCECCGTVYKNKAGGLGARCLVVHHKKQLKDTDQPRETHLSELAVVCANCHMMLHSNPAKALSIRELQRRLHGRKL